MVNNKPPTGNVLKSTPEPWRHFSQFFTTGEDIELYVMGSDLPFIGKIVNLDNGYILIEELVNTDGRMRYTRVKQSEVAAYRWYEEPATNLEKSP